MQRETRVGLFNSLNMFQSRLFRHDNSIWFLFQAPNNVSPTKVLMALVPTLFGDEFQAGWLGHLNDVHQMPPE